MGTTVVKCYEYDWDFVFTVKTDNLGTSGTNQFTLPTNTSYAYNYFIDWGDSSTENITINTSQTHTYPSPGVYKIRIRGEFPSIYFSSGGDKNKLIGVDYLGRVNWRSFFRSLMGCLFLEYINWGDWSTLTNGSLYLTFADTKFTSFPALDFSKVINMDRTFANCSSLLSFPDVDTSNVTFLSGAWSNCNSLTTFPRLNTSKSTNFANTWRRCSSLVDFPSIDISKGTNFRSGWEDCTSLENFPANLFDNWVGVPANQCFYSTWANCTSLTAQSVENILVSIDVSGRSAPSGVNTNDKRLDIDYNVATGVLSSAANTAIANLKSKGWKPFINNVEQ